MSVVQIRQQTLIASSVGNVAVFMLYASLFLQKDSLDLIP